MFLQPLQKKLSKLCENDILSIDYIHCVCRMFLKIVIMYFPSSLTLPWQNDLFNFCYVLIFKLNTVFYHFIDNGEMDGEHSIYNLGTIDKFPAKHFYCRNVVDKLELLIQTNHIM